MSNILTNCLIGKIDTLWCNGSTEDSDSSSLGSNPSRVVFKLADRKKDMEMQSDNLESDPFKPQGTGLDFTQREIAYDIKSHINGYRELLAERQKASPLKIEGLLLEGQLRLKLPYS